MIHFENIWNEAESVSKSYLDLDRKTILKKCRDSVNDLSDAETEKDYSEILGSILFNLCSLLSFLNEKGIVVNSAEALRKEIENQRKIILNTNSK